MTSLTYSIGRLHMYSMIQHDLTWDGGIGHCAKDNTNSVFKNMDIDSEKICMANFLVTTVLLQKNYVIALHMARVPRCGGKSNLRLDLPLGTYVWHSP